MAKNFEIVNGNLQVTVDLDNVVYIPAEEGKQTEVGKYVQTTVQTIPTEHIEELYNFVKSENGKMKVEIDNINKQLEPLKDLQDIDNKIMQECKKQINRGTKPFKVSMQALSKRIMDLDKKKTLVAQLEYYNKQYKQSQEDLEQLDKIL